MKMSQDQVLGFYPSLYMQFRSPLAQFPMVFNLTGDCVVGNSSGFSNKALYGGFGEYVERHHFYNEISSNRTAKLDEANRLSVAKKIYKLINQVKKTTRLSEEHTFDLTLTRNIFTGEKVYIPQVMISLAHGNSPDREFIPFVDSCGQASHKNKQEAFLSAFKEFIERQALIGAWLTGKACYQIKIEQHPTLGDANPIIEMLNRYGKLFAFDLNHYLPGYGVIVFYFSNHAKDNVQYSVGMAADFSPSKALNRSIHELWQSYVFMYLNTDNPENLDPRYKYLNELIQFNSHTTKKMIPFLDEETSLKEMNDFVSQVQFNRAEMIVRLNAVSHEIVAYENSSYFLGEKYHFCKLMSPDFFLHMGILMPLNFENFYAKLLKVNKSIHPVHPIPFP